MKRVRPLLLLPHPPHLAISALEPYPAQMAHRFGVDLERCRGYEDTDLSLTKLLRAIRKFLSHPPRPWLDRVMDSTIELHDR